MASWIVHLRIADRLLSELAVRPEQFVAGSIAPDCGVPVKEGMAYEPPASVTHWAEDWKKERCNYEAFYQRYLETETDFCKRSFYLGYYVHLMTDVMWVRNIWQPTSETYRQQELSDPDFVWKVKADWYDQDFLFLKKHPGFPPYCLLSQLTNFPNLYLDYYGETAIETKIREIVAFYQQERTGLEREYPYLDETRLERFIQTAVENVTKILEEKKIMSKRRGRFDTES